MKSNMGVSDRVVRLLVGGVIVGLGVYKHTWWGAVGGILLLTALIGWCPLYCPLHISTKKS